jgi:hypothetical protein
VTGGRPAAARTVEGPYFDLEATAPAVVEPSRHGAQQGETLARQRTEADLLAPVPAAVLGGMFLAHVQAAAEQREVTDAPRSEPADLSRPSVLGAGALFLPHLEEGAPKLFVGATRFGRLRFHADQQPMTELVFGADLLGADLPFRLAPADSDQTVSRLYLQYRQFPGFRQWLLGIGHSIDHAGGAFLDAELPRHVLLGWHDGDGTWRYYGGVRWTQREYPFDDGAESGWMDGYDQALLLGLRRVLVRPVFLAVEAGVEKESMRWVNERGEELLAYNTRNAPWGKLALETWIQNP